VRTAAAAAAGGRRRRGSCSTTDHHQPAGAGFMARHDEPQQWRACQLQGTGERGETPGLKRQDEGLKLV